MERNDNVLCWSMFVVTNGQTIHLSVTANASYLFNSACRFYSSHATRMHKSGILEVQ